MRNPGSPCLCIALCLERNSSTDRPLAHLLNGDHAAQHRCDDRGFAPRSPAFGVGWQPRLSTLLEHYVFGYAHHIVPSRRSSRAVPTKLRATTPIRPIDLAQRGANLARL